MINRQDVAKKNTSNDFDLEIKLHESFIRLPSLLNSDI